MLVVSGNCEVTVTARVRISRAVIAKDSGNAKSYCLEIGFL